MTLVLLKSHPYVKNFEATLTEWTGGKVRVKWREFDTQKVDEIFDSRPQAEKFAACLKENCHLVDDYAAENFHEHDKFWRSIYK